MINKFLKISQLIAFTTIFSMSNVFAASTKLSDDELEKARGLVTDIGTRLKSMILNADHEGGSFNNMYQTVRGMDSRAIPIKSQVLTAQSTSQDFDIIAFVNPKGSNNIGAMNNETGIYIKFSNTVPLLLKNKTIAIVAQHGSFDNPIAASKKLISDDFLCYTDIDGLDQVATFSGENISSTEDINLLMFSELTEDDMRFLATCKKKSFNKFTITETDKPMSIEDKPGSLNIRISPSTSSGGGNGKATEAAAEMETEAAAAQMK